MKCDRCDKEATVHEVKIRAGKRQERHLCEACAKLEGVSGGSAGGKPHIPITQLLNTFITSQSQPAAEGTPAGGTSVTGLSACPTCGLTVAQFRQTGLLGCPDCYAAFEAQLAPLLQRAHEGGTHHTGRRPRRVRGVEPMTATSSIAAPGATPARAAGGETTPVEGAKTDTHAAQRAELREKMAAAVAAERYEEAARLRDELARLESGGAAGTEKPPVKAPGKAAPKARGPKRGEEPKP